MKVNFKVLVLILCSFLVTESLYAAVRKGGASKYKAAKASTEADIGSALATLNIQDVDAQDTMKAVQAGKITAEDLGILLSSEAPQDQQDLNKALVVAIVLANAKDGSGRSAMNKTAQSLDPQIQPVIENMKIVALNKMMGVDGGEPTSSMTRAAQDINQYLTDPNGFSLVAMKENMKTYLKLEEGQDPLDAIANCK